MVEAERKDSPLKRIFQPDHVAAAIWAAVIALGGFVGGIAVQVYRGPTEVIVTNPILPKDTLFVRSLEPSNRDSTLASYLERLTHEIERLGAVSVPNVTTRSPFITNESVEANRLAPEPIALPPMVKGYTGRSLSEFAQVNCPRSRVQQGQLVLHSFRWLGTAGVEDFTSIVLDVVERHSPRSYTLRQNQYFELRRGQNVLPLVAQFPTGTYEVTFGVYRLSALNQEYPRLYRHTCDLIVE